MEDVKVIERFWIRLSGLALQTWRISILKTTDKEKTNGEFIRVPNYLVHILIDGK